MLKSFVKVPRGTFFESLILLIPILVFFVGDTYAYLNDYYAGDGFISYQWARNIASGMGNFEGPTFEHPWGSHSYLTFLVFVPFVRLFRSPMVLMYASWFLYTVSVVVLYLWAKKELEGVPGRIAFAIAFAYVMHPLTGEGMSGFLWSFFQPEVQFPLAIFLAITSFFRGQTFWCIGALTYLVLCKEEYIVVVPVLVLWMFLSSYVLNRSVRLRVFPALTGLSLYFLAAYVSRLILKHFRELNVYDHITRNADLRSVIPWQDFLMLRQFDWGILANSVTASATIIPLVIVALLSLRWRALLVLFMTYFGFVVFRLVADRYIYGPRLHTLTEITPGLAWANWARLIIPTMLALASVLAARSMAAVFRSRPWVAHGITVVIVFTSISFWCIWPPVPVVALMGDAPFAETQDIRDQKASIARVSKEIISADSFPLHPYKTIALLPLNAWEPFFTHLTMAQYNTAAGFDKTWESHQGISFKEQAYFIVAKKIDLGPKSIEKLREFKVAHETKDFVLLERDASIYPVEVRQWRYW